jgi:hypothetical protein
MQASAGGGAASVSSGAAANLSDVTFRGNSASQQGAGALQIRYIQRVELNGVLLSSNKVRFLLQLLKAVELLVTCASMVCQLVRVAFSSK